MPPLLRIHRPALCARQLAAAGQPHARRRQQAEAHRVLGQRQRRRVEDFFVRLEVHRRTYETNARCAVYLSSARDESSACSLSRIAKTFDAFVLSLRSGIRACWSRFTIGASEGSSMSSARPLAVYRAVRPVRWM